MIVFVLSGGVAKKIVLVKVYTKNHDTLLSYKNSLTGNHMSLAYDPSNPMHKIPSLGLDYSLLHSHFGKYRTDNILLSLCMNHAKDAHENRVPLVAKCLTNLQQHY